MKPLFANYEKRDEETARKRVKLAANGRASSALLSKDCQGRSWMKGYDACDFIRFINQLNEMFEARVFITPIYSFCARRKPEWKLEALRVESRKSPSLSLRPLAGFLD